MEYKENVFNKRYTVQTAPTDHAFFGGVFEDSHALCDALGSTKLKDCENAVAATAWRFSLGEDLYGANGEKRILKCECNIEILLPQWKAKQGRPRNKDKVHRFLSATATHERGHGVACTSVANITRLLAASLPDKIPADKVPAVNGAFSYFVSNFYTPLAHQADGLFDDYTHHGGLYEAQLSDGDDSTDEEDIGYMYNDTLPGQEESEEITTVSTATTAAPETNPLLSEVKNVAKDDGML
jgi:hypothetical protein